MSKIKNLPLIILGACNKVMSIFIPITLTTLWISAAGVSGFSAAILIIVGICSTLFRGIQPWID